jgi:hypothetical protein
MKFAVAMALFAAVAAFNVGSTIAHAADMVDYRANHDQAGCRVVEIQTTNRWGTDVTVRRLICG